MKRTLILLKQIYTQLEICVELLMSLSAMHDELVSSQCFIRSGLFFSGCADSIPIYIIHVFPNNTDLGVKSKQAFSRRNYSQLA